MTISIVIPNWNGIDLLKANLPKVVKASPEATEIIVSDDASTDDSVGYITSQYPKILIVTNAHHKGFASNVNSGVNIATGDIVVLLNTDVIPSEGYLKPLLVHFADPLVFAVGCLDKSIERNASVDRGRGKIFWSKGFLMHKKEVSAFGKTGWVSGGSGAFRRSIWNILGGMDPLYNPFYWEDIDLSYRANKAGYLTFFDPTSMVTHLHEQGKIMKEYSQTVVKTIAYRNQFIFVWKNISNPTLILDHFFRLPIHLLQAITRGDMPFILGFLFSCAKAPKIFFSRRRAARLWKKSDTELFKL